MKIFSLSSIELYIVSLDVFLSYINYIVVSIYTVLPTLLYSPLNKMKYGKNRTFYLILLWSVVCFLVLVLLWLCMYLYGLTLHVEFLSPLELYSVLISDTDDYYSTFYETDLKVRNVENTEQYKMKIQESVGYPNLYQKYKLYFAVNDAQRFFRRKKQEYGEFWSGCDMEKLIDIPWKFGIMNHGLYENGLPHTRKDVILLEQTLIDNIPYDSCVATLIHEKIHVYQKQYPKETSAFVLQQYTKVKQREESDNVRANPDTDEWIYMDNETGETLKMEYVDRATRITDVKHANQRNEHPYEKMAVDIENVYLLEKKAVKKLT